ncbi:MULTISPECIES: type II toxin-antitoxin system VapC family toxin [unclassified Burkholderia]|uniref:type II toxin-antitoxin system VapC family toxin n=1 Tax=unclassified Burkholderia TaxID=2613784 RepID=UPI000F58F931|nr:MULTISPECIES: type II toxin-antitoxin system VapC family toxin [unclassified Burkholderia]RQR31224.1 type II toxin-antitoxin system VapC family toxin [Burkholderia sp. Bp9131]RQR74877.1 type II toxin-antitoxin system VapC family toxin [Burkholderia sp. Bp9015]RQS01281.1 type II toxin-antitoxin system VapC family toxin [Burkholderia sp. Bp8994]RQS19629.1 type II toxin-antitoxin system VapC family toxin [Burkholderia sp. Bp8995]RQS31776.1 type II toxin-antitoxin system VapC family toxin [Burk
MILVDTNVISEPLRREPSAAVIEWLDAQNVETLFLAAISLAEMRFGVAALPEGRRRDWLHQNIEQRVVPLFRGRILPFDDAASDAYASLRGKARALGHTMAPADGFIAATAAANGLIVATRDVAPFEAAGLRVIDPWAR